MNSRRLIGGVHWSLWLVGAIALIWHGMGVLNYFLQMDPEFIGNYPESERAIIQGRPAWATGGFAIAVFGGTLGAIMLLFRKSAAFHLFAVSLAGAIVTMVHAIGAVASFGAAQIVGLVVVPLAVGGVLVWYALYARRKGWVR